MTHLIPFNPFVFIVQGPNACHQNQSLSNIHQRESSLQSSFTAVKDITDEKNIKTKTSDSMFGDNHSSDEQDDETNQNGENFMPPLNHRSGVPLSHTNDPEVNVLENRGSQTCHNSASLWDNAKNDCLQDVQSEVIETRTAACLPVSTNCDTSIMESQDAVDVSSTLSNEEDDRATHGTASIECNGDGDETDSKRRLMPSTT